MRAVWAASYRHLLRHPAQLALAIVGLSVGVATIIAVDIATASSGRAFELSMSAVNGASTHTITGGSRGVDERLYVTLRTSNTAHSGPDLALAPVVEGYVSVGERSMQLVGMDPFAALELDAQRNYSPGIGDLRSWFGREAVVMAADTARQLGLAVNDRVTVDIGGKSHTATLIAVLRGRHPGLETVLLTDISVAQEWLEMPGWLSRIDVRATDAAAQTLRARLPADVRLESALGRARQSVDMTAAFTANLKAMSMLALLVSTLLIYGAVSFAVVQRRRIFSTLRALGATRADVLTIVLVEAAVLGVVGAATGLLLGTVIAHSLIELVSRTINDLYFVVAVNETVLPPSSVAKALIAGLGTAFVGALLPALEVTGSSPQLGLRRSVLEARAGRIANRLFATGGGLAASSAIVVLASGRSLFAGFVALFLLLASVACVTPAVLRVCAGAAARLAGRISPVARLALGDIAASLSRTGVAVASLGMAIAAMIGVSIMVASFRESLREWLQTSLHADVYVTAPGPGAGRPERRIDPALVSAITTAPGVVDYGMSRRVVVEVGGSPVPIDAVRLAHGGYAYMPLTAGDPAKTWPAFARGEVVISEPLAYRLQLAVGQQLELPTDSGPRAFRICGIYREYGNDRGNVLMDLGTYRRLWHDEGVTALGLYLAPRVSVQTMLGQLREMARGRQSLLIRSNAELRQLSMSIFERTFVITRVLYWLAAAVAAIGLVSALLAWELERVHEISVLRSLGLTPGGAAVLIEAQTGFMGLIALTAAIPAGVLTAVLLIEVVNRRAFGWRIDLHLSVEQFANALVLAIAAAVVAGIYPAWRVSRTAIATGIREE